MAGTYAKRRSGPPPNRIVIGAFVVMVLIGGTNFIGVRFSNDFLPPVFGAAIRFAIASVLLFAWAAMRRNPAPKGRALTGALGFGVLNFGLGYALLYVGLQRASAGMTSVIMASVPLLTFFLAMLHRIEKFRVRGAIGGILAMAGIAAISSSSISIDTPLIYLLSVLGGAVCVAEAGVIVKLCPKGNPVTTNAIAMAVGTGLLAALSLIMGETWSVPQGAKVWLLIGYLALFGSIGLFSMFLFIIKSWTASATSYALTLTPVVAITLGVILKGETVTGVMMVGAALVLAGTYVGALYDTFRTPPPEKAEAAAGAA